MIEFLFSKEFLAILAVLVSPLIALALNRRIQEKREAARRELDKQWEAEKRRLHEELAAKERKLQVFRTLMSKRATGLSPEHVEALNKIEVEFYGDDEQSRRVLDAWKVYLDHLHVWTKEDKPLEGEALETWVSKKEDLLTELLQKMASCVGYHFDAVQIKRGFYYPQAYSNIEMEQSIIRRGLVHVLAGHTALPMDVRSFPQTASEEELKEQKEIRKALLKYFDGKIPLPVKVINEEEPQ